MSVAGVFVGLVQMSCSDHPQENLDKAVSKIVQAAKQGAQIVCLQELFRSRYFCQTEDPKFFQLAEPIPGPTTEVLGRVAKENKIVLVASLFEKAVGAGLPRPYYNTNVFFGPDGSILAKYRKLHIPDDLKNYYGEAFYFQPGDLGLPVVETPYGKIGSLVCWDQWFPEGARQLALKGAQIIFYPTAIGRPVTGHEALADAEHDAWQTIQRSHAIANGVFVAAANRVGVEDHLNFWGTSFVADPLGRVLKQASQDQEEVLVVECDLNLIQEVRSDWPFLKCRRPDVYGK